MIESLAIVRLEYVNMQNNYTCTCTLCIHVDVCVYVCGHFSRIPQHRSLDISDVQFIYINCVYMQAC